MLEELLKRLESLGNKKVVIKANGNYPDKKNTPVQHVAHYQNDGTDKIKPAKFVESAKRKAGSWKKPTSKAVNEYLTGDDTALMDLGIEIATDINDAVNRIKTGRLKRSMTPEVR